MPDVEIEAMGVVSSALDGLDEEQRSRVLRWAADRFGLALPGGGRPARPPRGSERDGAADESQDDFEDEGDEAQDADNVSRGPGQSAFEHFAELYDACGPSSTSEKALVGAYWVQELNGKATWTSFDVNKILKDLGHGDSKINRTFTNLVGQKPAKVLQIRRAGKTRQARKTFKLTAEGIKRVKEMMRS